MIDRTSLMQGSDHLAVGLAERDIPRANLGLGGRRYHEVEAVRELLEDNDRPRETATLAVNLRADILADGSPPDITDRDKGRRLGPAMKFLLEADPLEKAVHMRHHNTPPRGEPEGYLAIAQPHWLRGTACAGNFSIGDGLGAATAPRIALPMLRHVCWRSISLLIGGQRFRCA